MTPEALLVEARQLARQPGDLPARGAALLARQALEGAMFGFFRDKARGVETATFTTQLLCLQAWLDEELAHRAAYAWAALSHVCHHAGYVLPPTGVELRAWLDTVEELISACS